MKFAHVLLLLPLWSACVVSAQDQKPTHQPTSPTTRVVDAFTRAKPWVADALQISDVKKRDAAIATIRAAITSADAIDAHAGLIALSQIRDVVFDKKSFREIVLPHLAAKSGAMRLSAMYALAVAGREPGDLDLILTAAEGVTGPERLQLVHPIAMFSDLDLTGKAGDVVLKLIGSDERRDVRQSLSGLWGAKVSPAIEKRLLDLANGKDPENAHDAIYFGLSTLRDKSAAVIDRLIAALADPDRENGWRALWGLGQGVLPADEPRVADAVLQLFEARGDAQTRENSLHLLERYGLDRHAAALDNDASQPGITESLATRVHAASAAIRKRIAAAQK